jgi:ankyrin repeat protein
MFSAYSNTAFSKTPILEFLKPEIAERLKENDPSLTQADLSKSGITATGAKDLVEVLQHNTSLTQLNLAINGIRDIGAKDLAQILKHNMSLAQLDLSDNRISDVGAKHLATVLQYNISLKQLNLSNNNISDVGVKSLLVTLQYNTSLVQLDLSDNKISRAGVEYLKSIEVYLQCNREAVEQRAQQALNHFEQGQKRVTQERYFEAMIHFNQALSLTPQNEAIQTANQHAQERCKLVGSLPLSLDLMTSLLEACQAAIDNQVQQLIQLTTSASVLYAKTGYTALHVAAATGQRALVKQLLVKGNDIHAVLQATGQTPLHLAIQAGHQECANALIQGGTPLDVLDNEGQTPQNLIAKSLFNHHNHWLETAKHLAYTYKQEQQLRHAQTRRLAQARTFAEEKQALQQQLHALSNEDVFSTSLVALRQTLQDAKERLVSQDAKLYQTCVDQLVVLQPPALLLKQTCDYSLLDKAKAVREVAPNHPLFKNLQKVQRSLLSLSQAADKADYGKIGISLKKIAQCYDGYITQICQTTTQEREALYRPPMRLHVVGVPPRLLQGEVQNLFAKAATQQKSDSDAATGTSVVKAFQGIHFKRDPHAPGVEFMVGALGRLLIKRGITPSELIKVVDTATGFSMPYLASKTVIGVELGHVIHEHPDYLTRIRPENFSAMVVLSLLIDPQDGKPDNYMVELETDEKGQVRCLDIIGIDNDIAFGEPSLYRHTSGIYKDQPFVTVKNVLYFFPQMQMPLHPTFRQHFLEQEPATLLLEWLQALCNQNRYYQQLVEEGVFTEDEFHGSKIRPQGLKLPIKLKPGTLIRLYHKLCTLQTYLQTYPEATHQALFEQVEPSLAHHYQAIQHRYPNDIMVCLRRLYLDALAQEQVRDQLTSQLRSCHTSALTRSVLNSIELRTLEAQQTQTIEEAVLELIAALDYQHFVPTAFNLWYQQLQVFPWSDSNHPADPPAFYRFVLNRGLATESLVNHLVAQCGLSLDTRYSGGDTLLHLAVQQGQVAIAAWLLSQGIEVDATNEAGYTSLHVAASRNDTDVIALLLTVGAKQDYCQSSTGHTALDKALNRGQETAAKLLLKRGAKHYLPVHQAKVTTLLASIGKPPASPLPATPPTIPRRLSAAASSPNSVSALLSRHGLLASQRKSAPPYPIQTKETTTHEIAREKYERHHLLNKPLNLLQPKQP